VDRLSPEKLFSIFEQDDYQVYKENQVQHLLDSPYIRLSMVITGVDNYQTLDMLYNARFKHIYQEARQDIKYKYYTKLFRYLTSVTIQDVQELYNMSTNKEIYRGTEALQNLLQYFESIEHYEKCNSIFQYLQILEQNK